MASKPGDLVLDCFVGGGSTLHAAELHGRSWIGVEKGAPRAALSRIKTFLETTEVASPPLRLRNPFVPRFARAMLEVDPKSPDRPIRTIRRMTNISAEKFKSRTRVGDIPPCRLPSLRPRRNAHPKLSMRPPCVVAPSPQQTDGRTTSELFT